MKKIYFLTVLISTIAIFSYSQTFISPTPGYTTFCPGDHMTYSIDPGDFTDCGQVTWTIAKGTFVYGQSITTTTTTGVNKSVDVWWNDETGSGTLTATSTCEEGVLSTTSNYPIRSLNNRNLENARANNTLPYCSTSSVNIQVDQMLLENTGGTTGIIQQYADGYEWELPVGWKSSGNSGTVTSASRIITITPDDGCAGGTVHT